MDRKYNAVIFDMDGVIFDSEKLVLEGWQELARKYGFQDVEKIYDKCIGVNATATKQIFLDYYGEDFPYDTYKKETSAAYHAKYDGGRLPQKPGVKELLTFLKEHDFKIGLASSTRIAVVEQQIVDAGLREYFDDLTGGDMLQKSKPEPDIYLMACEHLGVDPKEAIAIEDSYNGIRSAARAGMAPVMVPDMMAPNTEMERLAIKILADLYQVKAWMTHQVV